MNHVWIIYTYGNADFLYNILMSIGSFFGGSAAASMIKLAIATALLVVVTQLTGAMSTGQSGRPFEVAFFFRFYLIYTVLVMLPAGKIVLQDEMTNQPKVITTSSSNRIPLGVVAINSFSSVVVHGFITVYERYFMTGSSGNVALSYSKSGMAFGANFIAGLPTMTTGDVEFENNLKNYFANCALPLAYSQGAMSSLAQETDILGFFNNNMTDVQKNRWVSQTSGGTMVTTTCADAIKNLNTTWNSNSQQYLTHVAHMVGYPNAIASNFITAANMSSNDLLQVSNGASDALKQAISMNMIYKSIYSGAAQVDNASLANAVYDAQQFQQYQGGGAMANQQAARVVPALKIFAESMLFILYPLLIFYALLTTNFLVVVKYIKWSLTIATIPLVYEIISALIYWYSSAKTGGIMGEGGFNIMNASGLYDLNASIAATANWLSMSTPVLAYAIVSGSDMAITSFFGHATDPAKSVSGGAGDQFSKGNLGFGNTSIDNAGLNTLSANKFNNAMDVTSGSPQINDRINQSTVSTYGNGASTVQTTASSGPISDSRSSALSQQLSQQYSASIGETKQAGSDMMNAYRSAGQYAEGHGLSWSGGHDTGAGVVVSDGVSKGGSNTTQDSGSVSGGASVSANSGKFGGSSSGGSSASSGSFGVNGGMNASHSNSTMQRTDYDSKNISSDTNSWKHSDLYNHDQSFRTMVDATETAQHRYSESLSKQEQLQEQLQTAQQTSVGQSINTNDGAWKQALQDNNGNYTKAVEQYNDANYRKSYHNEERREVIGQAGVDSRLGVNEQNKNNFTNTFDSKFDNQQAAAGNGAEGKAQAGMANGQNVVNNSESGLDASKEMTKGKPVHVPNHENVDGNNGLPDAVNKMQNHATKVAQDGVNIGPSGYPTMNHDNNK